ncbi:cytochrome P450 9e2-like [Arctopsyche grandis]|uniref:cytochrome P450 9e2-like n=1 Tax=Arctopsyche grandis TaxID=121162 RepID=UPI00406D99D3
MFFYLSSWLTFVVTIILCLIAYSLHLNNFFKNRGINYLKPFPFFGNMFNVTIGKDHLVDRIWDVYNAFSKDRYVGIFNYTQPIVVIKDIELMKKITIKDFEHFVDHIEFTDEVVDPYFGKSMFSLKGDRWKEMRTTLSPAFTSSKMRGMLPFIDECGKKFVKHLNDSLGNEHIEFDIKDLTSRFSIDTIGTCAFGIQVDSLKDKENNFYKSAKAFSQFDTLAIVKFFLYTLCPKLFRLLKIEIGNKDSTSFFHNLLVSNMNTREKEKIVRHDMVHLLTLAKNGSLKTEDEKNEDVGFATIKETNQIDKPKKTSWTDEELTAQALIFIFAGFDTTSTALSFLLHELAMNPEFQKKIHEEIDELMKNNSGKIDYNDLNKLKYLDMAVTETLRLWPPVVALDRLCVKPYNLPIQNEASGVSHQMQPGDGLWIPVYSIQRDPQYFKNPNKFNPERFSNENKAEIDVNHYMPFGIGPRACIGSRFALMTFKIFAIHVLTNFEVLQCSKTMNPIKIKPHLFNMVPIDGHWGFFNFMSPIIIIKDLDLAKKIYIKDFDHFIDHVSITDEEVDSLLGKNLFSLKGDKWREMRSTLSPAFTSSKMRGMLPFIVDCSENFVNYLKKQTDQKSAIDKGYIEFNSKDLTSRFSNDVIATCAFGVKVDSLNDENNNFYSFSKRFTNITPTMIIKVFLYFLSPIIIRVLNLEISDKKSTSYFRNLVMCNIAIREKKNIVRHDMINLLMLAKNGALISDTNSSSIDTGFATVQEELHDLKLKKTQWTDDDLVAQALIFIFAGFDTISTALSFLLHELAMNHTVQKRLIEEIDVFFHDKNKDIDYNDLNKLKYLDMVISESLRLWPPAPILDRVCVKPYNLPSSNDSITSEHKLKIGDAIWISAFDIQRDPKFFQNPEKFDPERFSDDNKSSIDPRSYMPFGIGPRACIGSRFALMELKIFMMFILKNFEVTSTPKTVDPIKLKPHMFNLIPEGGFWIGFKQRNKSE